MDLFTYRAESGSAPGRQPLAERMRARTVEEYIGQEHIVGPGKLLRRAIEADQVSSIILFGPPGTGKTTLATVIANRTDGEFVRLNAVDASVKDVRETIERAKETRSLYDRKTILFLDEVHRFKTSQQDALLPAVEAGTIIFIGATTENPFHSINGALLSRSTLFRLEKLTPAHALEAMRRALADRERGLGALPIRADDDALAHIAAVAGGDLRRALNALELSALTTPPGADGAIHVTLAAAEESIRQPTVAADESTQYDVLSAFHKSVRGSSDAALFWFLYAVEKLGMDPMVFLRRLIVACSEDIGLANPQAMTQAVSAMDAYHKIGWPEARYNIAQAILFAVESPKSNSIGLAMERVYGAFERLGAAEVPLHLRDGHYKGSQQFGHVGYKYPHDFPGHYVEQQYLPDPIKESLIFVASTQGTEAKMRENQLRRRGRGKSE
ncbi:replication-associated recombination protein A [Paenibacillus sp.]|uniref:replication-associated recombination protein A n=1 Tax=Paenibacillus sp. TaxID=58172 RepID=UPI002D4D8B9B|nr:replication-associated recombination protein A [Paenibacillus sp.]HZG56415.1 replication-associated recombination protein A [Paenibacillus sp.]